MRCCWCEKDGLVVGDTICPHPDCKRAVADFLPPETLLHVGQYRIVKALGKGGFGITYQAFDTEFERTVAVKEFFPNCARRDPATGAVFFVTHTPLESDSIKIGKDSFLREGRNLARVEHPNIPAVYDKFPENDTAYLVMAFIDGQSLTKKMPVVERTPEGQVKRRQALPESETRRIMDDLVAALAVAHKQGVYHLDIKPDNVLIEKETGRAFLVDFGAARQKVTFDTSSEVALTPAYAPLELLARQTLGPFTDIFELGMMLHQMLTGELPPQAQSRLISPVLSAWRPAGLSEPWQSLLTDALQMDPAKRPTDIRGWWSKAMIPAIPFRLLEPIKPDSVNPHQHITAVVTPATTITQVKPRKKPKAHMPWFYLAVGIGGFALAGILIFGNSLKPAVSTPTPAPNVHAQATATPKTLPKLGIPNAPTPDPAGEHFIEVKERTTGRTVTIPYEGKPPTREQIRLVTYDALKQTGYIKPGKPSLNSLVIVSTKIMVKEYTTGRSVTIPFTGEPPTDAEIRLVVYGALKAAGHIKPGKTSFDSLDVSGVATGKSSDSKSE